MGKPVKRGNWGTWAVIDYRSAGRYGEENLPPPVWHDSVKIVYDCYYTVLQGDIYTCNNNISPNYGKPCHKCLKYIRHNVISTPAYVRKEKKKLEKQAKNKPEKKTVTDISLNDTPVYVHDKKLKRCNFCGKNFDIVNGIYSFDSRKLHTHTISNLKYCSKCKKVFYPVGAFANLKKLDSLSYKVFFKIKVIFDCAYRTRKMSCAKTGHYCSSTRNCVVFRRNGETNAKCKYNSGVSHNECLREDIPFCNLNDRCPLFERQSE